MQSEEKFDQVKVRQWVCSIAPGIYEAARAHPSNGIQSHSEAIVFLHPPPAPVRGAPWEMCMRDCVADLILVTKTLERRLKLVFRKTNWLHM